MTRKIGKISTIFALLFLLCVSIFTLTACGDNDGEHIHIPNSAVIENETAATCSSLGSYDEVVYCTECSEEISRTTKTIEKLSHTPSEWITDTEVTCKVEGSKHRECTKCEEVLETATVDKLSTHTPGEAVTENFVDSNCETEGSYNLVTYCSVCDAKLTTESKNVEKKPHTSSDWIIDKGATCKEAGSKHKECTKCEEVLETAVIDKLTTHTPASAVVENKIDSTCSELGSYDEVVKCSVCGIELSREEKGISRKDHTPSGWITDTNPTCKTEGAKHKECTVCHTELETGKIDKLTTHTPASVVVENKIDSTCSELGSYDEVVKCSVCGIELSREEKEIGKLPHTETSDIAVEPTCTETGLTAGKHCSVCNEVIVAQEIVKANGHKDENTDYTCDICTADLCTEHEEEIIPSVSATCTETGLTEGKKCSICGDILVAQEIVKANGHTEVIDKAKAPTCTETGLTEGKHCSVCSTVLVAQEAVKANGHTQGEWIIDIEPTIYEPGSKHTECEICQEVLEIDIVDILASYNVTFKQADEDDIIIRVVANGALTDIPKPKEKIGYTVKWDAADFSRISENLVVSAVETPITYTITYVLSYGSVPVENPKTYTIETVLSALENPSDSFGMKFAGWFTSPDFTTTSAITHIGGGITGDLTLYGKFVSYRVESVTGFDMDYSSGTPKISAVVNNATVEIDMKPLIAVSKGSTYKVYGDKYGKEPYDFSILPLNIGKNVFYLAVFHPNNSIYYTLYELHIYRLDMKDYTFIDTLSTEDFYENGLLEENSTLSAPSNPQHVGYTFNGWKLNGEEDFVSFPYTLSEDAVFVAVYTPIVYTITYELSGGEYLGEFITEYTIESKIDLPVPTRKDYSFKGWSVGGDYNTIIHSIDGSVGNLELYAYWQYDFVYSIENGEVTITDYLGKTKTECQIPDTIDGYPVKHIAAGAFSGCSSLESVIIPDFVISIGEGAFSGCSSMAYMELPFVGESIKSKSDAYQYPLGYIFGTSDYNGSYSATQYYYAVSTTSSISTVFYIPSSLVEIKVSRGEILHGAFWNCSSLVKVTMPSDITEIGFSAFRACSSLKSINIPGGITKIDEYAFRDCTSLEEVYATSIASWLGITFTYGYYANPLAYAGKLYIDGNLIDEVVIPESITAIQSYAFYNCESISKVTMHDGVTDIGTGAFYNCTSLTEVSGCNGVETLGADAFRNCTNLGGALEFDSLKSIGSRAFNNCSSLKSIVIGNNVTSIPEGLLSGCSSLKSVVLPFVGDKIKTSTAKYQYPLGYIFGTSSFDGATAAVQYYYGSSTSSTSYTTYHVPSSLKSITVSGGNILYGAFYNLSSVTEIVIRDDVENIVAGSFYGCSALEKLTIPFVGTSKDATSSSSATLFGSIFGTKSFGDARTVKQYYSESGYSTYYIPNNLYSVTITGGIVLYGSFDSCFFITDIGIGKVGKIEENTFSNCAIENLYILDLEAWCNITFASRLDNPICSTDNVYVNGELLKDLVVPDGVTSISDYAFYLYLGLESAIIPESVAEVGKNAFGSIEYNVLNQYDNAYYLGTADNPYYLLVKTIFVDITECTIHDDTKIVNSGAFDECDNMTYFTEDGLCYIGSEINPYMVLVNAESTDITSIVIKESTMYILEGAFDRCWKVTELVVPDGINFITEDTFSDCTAITNATVPAEILQFLYQGSLKVLVINGNSGIEGFEFKDNTQLTAVTIGDGVTSIGDKAFYGCTSLNSVTIGNAVTKIGVDAFYGCTSLRSVKMGTGLTHIGSGAFALNSDKLLSVYITDLVAWCNIAFEGYYSNPLSHASRFYVNGSIITDLIIPDVITSIGAYTFVNCDSFVSINFPNSLTSIGREAFFGCSGLTDIIIPDSVTKIGVCAFQSTSLSSIVIGSSIERIDYGAFWGSKFEIVYYRGTKDSWSNIIIDSSNTGLTSATICYYSETVPPLNADGTAYDGYYWYYDESGNIVEWAYNPEE